MNNIVSIVCALIFILVEVIWKNSSDNLIHVLAGTFLGISLTLFFGSLTFHRP